MVVVGAEPTFIENIDYPYEEGVSTFGSPYGQQRPGGEHLGLDIVVVYKREYAKTDGELFRPSDDNASGINLWEIAPSGKFYKVFHLSSTLGLPVGGRVKIKRGDLIAISGSTGASTGPHGHHEEHEGNPSNRPPKNPTPALARARDAGRYPGAVRPPTTQPEPGDDSDMDEATLTRILDDRLVAVVDARMKPVLDALSRLESYERPWGGRDERTDSPRYGWIYIVRDGFKFHIANGEDSDADGVPDDLARAIAAFGVDYRGDQGTFLDLVPDAPDGE